MSLSGIYVAARRLLSSSSPLPLGIGLWGAHGLIGLAAVGLFIRTSANEVRVDAEGIRPGIPVYCIAALTIQLLIGLGAACRLVRRQARAFSDVVGSAVCIAYALMMGGWALLLFKSG